MNNTATSGVSIYIYIVHAYICRKCLYIYMYICVYIYIFMCVFCLSTYTIYNIYIYNYI